MHHTLGHYHEYIEGRNLVPCFKYKISMTYSWPLLYYNTFMFCLNTTDNMLLKVVKRVKNDSPSKNIVYTLANLIVN